MRSGWVPGRAGERGGVPGRLRGDWTLVAVLAAVSYLPLFLTRPGAVAADTKQYLYIDPAKLTSSAAYMWDPNTGMGTVTHQNIGYLFPMGPYYTAVHWLGIPVWVGQRIWMGTLILAAGLGVAYCARLLGLEGPGRVVAALAYALSPYTIDYLDRISAILMPWSALGWLMGLTILAARTGRWRYAASFGLVVALVGGVNATSILLVLLAPAVWLGYAVLVSHEVTGRRAWSSAARLAGVGVAVSVWWAAGLWAEGRYGINVLRVTETVPTVSRTSSAAEVLRGLGYWYFYGWDKVQPWTIPAVQYTQSLWLLGLSLTVPAISVALAFVTRWRYRAFAVALVGAGTVVAVGAYPYSHPSLFGGALKAASAGSSLALAMRSVDRIVPLVVLGLALLMGSGVTAVHLRWSRLGLGVAAACAALIAAELPALWTGGMIASNLSRPAGIPSYWYQAAAYLNAQGSSSRVLGVPGEDFAAYSWGIAADPVGPGLLNRPYIGRQVVPSGTPAAANLLQALDEPLQEGTLDPAALAPIARLMSAGQILLQSDLQYERYHLPLPQVLWQALRSAPGLGPATAFGGPNPATTIRYPLDSELRLGLPVGTPQPPALTTFAVPDPRALVRAEPVATPVVVAGDGSGLVEAAAAGLLDGSPTIFYSGSLDRASFDRAMSEGAELIVTDTNPLAADRWGSLRDNVGQVQQPGVSQLSASPSDYSLPLFPGSTDDSRTVAELSGVASVQASSYGDSLTFTPENRPVNAVDGDLATAWSYGAHSAVARGHIDINLQHPITTDHVNLIQAQLARPNRRITSVTLSFDGRNPTSVRLTPASFEAPGQSVSFPARTFSRLRVTVDAAGPGGGDKRYDGLAQVGFAEIGIPGVAAASEDLRLPTDLLSRAGTSSLQDPLALLMQRSRAIEPPRHDPQPQMARAFDLPTARTFSVTGTAEINADDSDNLINDLVGLSPPPGPRTGTAVVAAADSSTRLDGDRSARANAAVDGSSSTAWIAETGPQAGEWISYALSRPVTFGHLALQVVNDGRHSLPTAITITTEAGVRHVALPPQALGRGRPQGATTAIPVTFAPITGRQIKVTIDTVQPVEVPDYYSTFARNTDILPVGIAELGFHGVVQPPTPVTLPSRCNSGLLSVDGRPVDVEVAGATAAALGVQPLSLVPCGNSVGGVHLGPGRHVVQTSGRVPSGWSIDELRFESAAGGGPARPGSLSDGRSGPASTAPSVKISHQTRTSVDVTVDGDGSPYWLVLGQSYSDGWRATLPDGRSLGRPQLIDGYANGWMVPAGDVHGPTTIRITWTPQRVVWIAIAISAAAVVVSLPIALLPAVGSPLLWRRSRRRRPAEADRLRGLAPASARPWPASARLWSSGRTPMAAVRSAVMAALMWGIVAATVSRPLIGLLAAAAVFAGSRWSRGRLVVRVATVASLLSVPVYSVEQQWTHRYWPTIDWPASVSSANDLAWLGLALLGADVVVGLLRSRAASTLAGGRDRRD